MLKFRRYLAFATMLLAANAVHAEDPSLRKFFPLHAQNYNASGKKFLPVNQESQVSHGVKITRPQGYATQASDADRPSTSPQGFFTMKRYQPQQRPVYAMGGKGYYRAQNVQPVLASLPFNNKNHSSIASAPNTSNELRSNVPYKTGFYGASQIGVTAHSWPLDAAADQRISSGFGWRKHPVTGRGALHKGVDIAAPTGTPVIATAEGIVEETGQDGLIGKYVKLRHPDGSQSLYGHLSRVDVQQAQWLNRYQGVGAVGMTGRTTGPHLHYALNLDGKAMDPMGYLSRNHQMAAR